MDRIVFGKKTSSGQRERVDRFVASRYYFEEMRRRWGVSRRQAVDIWYAKNRQRKNYVNYLDEAFGLEPTKYRSKEDTPDDGVQPWPCRPRKKSFLSSADSILDLPTFGYAIFPELLDWSNDNILVAALGDNYHKWSWRTQSLISQGRTSNQIQCCKFDPRGELLVLGTDTPTVEMHSNERNKCFTLNCCNCLSRGLGDCSITALDWSPTGNSFVSGCSRGSLVSYTRSCLIMHWYQASRKAILMVRVSPDARFVAATAVHTHLILVLSWPGLQRMSNVNSNWHIKNYNHDLLDVDQDPTWFVPTSGAPCRLAKEVLAKEDTAKARLGKYLDLMKTTMTWHPWRSALLGVGAVTDDLEAHLVLCDAPTLKVKTMSLGTGQHNVEAMLFSHRTGELVLSLYDAGFPEINTIPSSRLVVMSDPETVVDHWGEGRSGLDRVRTMMFSPDGTKLATATADEDLIIWNFLPEDNCKKKKRTKSRRFSALPVYLDEAVYGDSVR